MAMTDDPRGTAVDQAHYCRQCGHPVDGNFCSGCGTMVATTVTMPAVAGTPPHSPSADTPPHSPPSGKPPSVSRGRVGLIAAGAALGLAAVAVAVIILSVGSSTSRRATPPPSATLAAAGNYRQKLGAALSPVIAANQKLSSALTNIDGSQPTLKAAANAATAAQQALTTARGAIGELTAPSADTGLSQQADQALTQDSGYLQAVSGTLSDPTGQTSGQLQTLSTNTQAAFVPINALVPGASGSVSGTGNLASWDASARGLATEPSSHTSTVTQTTTAPSNPGGAVPTSGTTVCGGGLIAGPNTTCPFATNVQQAWDSAPGQSATVQAFSPATGRNYTMACSPDAGGIACYGGNNASVFW